MSELLQSLVEATFAGSAAVLLVLVLRRPLRARFGAVATYALWSCVPAALLAVLLPAAVVDAPGAAVSWATPLQAAIAAAPAPAARVDPAPWLLALWACGAVAMLALLAWRQSRFVRALGPLQRRGDGCWQARVDAGLPAVIGVLRPRIVLPAGFEVRYLADEQALILQHERLHVRRGDLQLNALAALLQCLAWFNPLAWIALRRFRLDQELACDARVLAGDPAMRRRYGETLLKTRLDAGPVPLGCHWQPIHPLKERIAMLGHPVPRRTTRLAASALVALLALGSGFAAWALQPADTRPAGAAGAAAGDLYHVDVRLDVDGHARQFALREHAGTTFGFRSEEGDTAWAIEMRLTPEADPALVRIQADLQADGTLLSRPELVARLDQKAGIQVSTPDGRSVFALDVTVRRLDAPVASAGGPRPAMPADRPPPRYPRSALAEGLSGEVLLVVDVDAEGAVRDARVERATPVGVFDAIALEAARQWRFQPARDAAGRAVPGQVRVPLRFDSGMTASAAPAGAAADDGMRWFLLDAGVASESVCDEVVRVPADARVYCGIRNAQAAR